MGTGVRAKAAILGALAVTAGCAAPGASLESAPDVVLWSVAAPLRAPVWSYHSHVLVALTEDHRLAEVAAGDRPGEATTRLSAPMAVGRNLQISQKDDRMVFVPQPDRGRVAEVDLESLRQVGDFDAGPAPAYLAEDAGLRTLLALSSDGTSVTPVDQYGFRKLPTAPIAGDPADSIDGANRGREIEYHVYAPSGIRHYQGTSSPAEERGSLNMDVAVSAGDGTAVTRSYVAGHDDSTLYAVDSRRGGDGLTVLASTRLPSPIRELGTDDTRIYAATDHEVVVLETASFTGFPTRTIPVIRVIGYRAGLPPAARSAALSGMAIGPHRVYLTLADTPYVVSVAKPRL
ncbi:hypothetical protein [Mycobacterium paraseoulense]|uniref:Uncharacterized protein n=1 Tax=Mycobacterium paraseoulense TaxID=590652 RepID=A0A1X0I820_9MYCO|nr:hypothetical protein [Mycobacterium paraseoulense]MCV7394250.1 hypothetical protein [Mycobacterium paraseoulense]ORB37654.1 hypothetical protein BST39_18360 [Mycobacterium paraseoulense]BBZ74010.1 hypothetical protein MPRS_51030 [Mycobacterium paraseoulense]